MEQKKEKQQPTQHPSKQSPSSSLIFVFRAPFWISFILIFFLCHSCTREKPIISQWRGRFLLRQTSFSLRFLLHCSPCPLWPTSPSPSSFFFLALWNWSVHQEKKGNECTLDSALNRLTHFIDDADDTLLMILIKIGSWQADMFQYESGYCGVWVHVLTLKSPYWFHTAFWARYWYSKVWVILNLCTCGYWMANNFLHCCRITG